MKSPLVIETRIEVRMIRRRIAAPFIYGCMISWQEFGYDLMMVYPTILGTSKD